MHSKKILYFQYTDPAIGYPPLEHSSEILANKGWQVLFLGITFANNVFSLKSHTNIKIEKLKFVKAKWSQKINFIWFNIWVFFWAWHWRPDWIYASNSTSAPAVIVLNLFYRDRIIYHEHDSPDTKNPVPTLFMRFIYWARVQIAQRVKTCVLPNHERVKIFEKEIGIDGKTVCVWNCPLLSEVRKPDSRRSKDVTVLYHGSLVPQRLPMGLLEALAKIGSGIKLRVTGYEAEDYADYPRRLKEQALRLGISERVEFSSAQTRAELLDMCHECDIGIAFILSDDPDVNMRHMLGASNKPFDYLACGLAVLVSDLPDWKAMFVGPGYGLACDPKSSESIAGALRWFLGHPKEMQAMGEKGRQKILSDWNYETQFMPVFEKINAACD